MDSPQCTNILVFSEVRMDWLVTAVQIVASFRRLQMSVLLLCGIGMLAGCGASPMTNTTCTSTGCLQSVALSPTTADAQNYPNGQIQFAAVAYYQGQSSPVSVTPTRWGVCQQNNPTTEVTVSSSGVAQCTQGASGTFTVFGSVPTTCNAITNCGGGCQVTGTAQLTCP